MWAPTLAGAVSTSLTSLAGYRLPGEVRGLGQSDVWLEGGSGQALVDRGALRLGRA